MCYLLIPTTYSAWAHVCVFLCWFPYMNDTVIVLLSLSKMRGIYCIPLCQLTVVVPRISNLSRVHVSSSLIPASSWSAVWEYRLSSLYIASLLSLFHPFVYPSLLPSPSLFPLSKAMRSCRLWKMSVICAKILVPGLQRQVRCCPFEIPFCPLLCMY